MVQKKEIKHQRFFCGRDWLTDGLQRAIETVILVLPKELSSLNISGPASIITHSFSTIQKQDDVVALGTCIIVLIRSVEEKIIHESTPQLKKNKTWCHVCEC